MKTKISLQAGTKETITEAFDQFTLSVFNQCENNNIIMTIDAWDNVHPMLKTIPVEWDYTILYGQLPFGK